MTPRRRWVDTLPPAAARLAQRTPEPDAAAPTLSAVPPLRPAPMPRRVRPALPTGVMPPIDNPGPALDPARDGAGQAPPVYPTRLPPPVLLQYALHYNGRSGEAQLAWQHDGERYRLQLSGQAAGRPLVEQSSSGGFDAAGLAPERFVDRRHGRAAQAANFDRERGRIGFSGPAVEHPAWPGAQDRLGWVAQLAAIAGALESWPDELRVFVVDARGAGDVWAFARQGSETIETPVGEVRALHLQRAPPSADALRVDAWIDPARGFWPARLRFTAPRSGDVFELLLAAEPGTPP